MTCAPALLMTESAVELDDVHGPLDWDKAVKGLPPAKRDIHLRIDADVLSWFNRPAGVIKRAS
jgi:uncharacterized protein (DUF4415 family)